MAAAVTGRANALHIIETLAIGNCLLRKSAQVDALTREYHGVFALD